MPSPLTGFTFSYTFTGLPVWGIYLATNNILRFNPPVNFNGEIDLTINYSDSKNIK